MSLTSLLSTRKSSNKSKSGHTLQLSMPLLCDIAENSTLKTVSPTASIEKIFKQIYKSDKKPIQFKQNDVQLNANAVEFVPSCPDTKSIDKSTSDTDTPSIHSQPQPTTKITSKFIPKHKPRAKYNIYIGKSETRNILSNISENFPTTSTLYYYLDVLTAFQMNDNQMNIFQTINQPKITFINSDLHSKYTNELLYASIIPNDQRRITQANKNNNLENTKWLWKLDEFLTAKQIFEKYNIESNNLPKSSRKIHKFYKYINKQEYINSNILYNIDWNHSHIRQIGPVKKSAKLNRNKFKINTNNFIRQCEQSWHNFVAIPIIVYENKGDTGFNYRCEWVKIVEINGSFVGISFCKCNNNNNRWKLQSVYLDKIDIENKHRLFGINNSNYTNIFNQFETSILEIKWL